jgi:Protein of unknown function (DUF2961)
MEGPSYPRPYRRSVGFPLLENRTSASEFSSHFTRYRSYLALGLVLAIGSPIIGQASPPDLGKGPVGWEIYRQLNRIQQLRSGEESREFSSTDPAQTNADFNHPLRVTSDGQYVLAEANGPGEIDSIWSTINGGDVTNDGAITIELDGKIVLSAAYEDVVSGKLGAPWVWPLVGNFLDTSGGAQIKVPMPYQQSMRVTVQGNPDYFHVIYRQFADASGVTTFNPTDTALDVIAQLRAFGTKDPKPPRRGAVTESANINIPAGSQSQLIQLDGPGEITELRLQLPQVQHAPYVIDDGRAFGSGGSSQFTVALDPGNNGVRLVRRYDPSIGNQKAKVLVNGALAGEWSSGPAVSGGVWADETIVIPASLTAGKSSIAILDQFESSDLDFNEFRYDVACLVNGEWTRTDTVDVGPNHPGEEQAHGYSIASPTWQGVRAFSYPVDGQTIANSAAVLTGARLQISFDGQTTVDAPIGEFFGSGLGKYDVRTLMFSIDNSSTDGWYTTWWPMPFARNAVVQIVNRSGVPIQSGKIEVSYAPDPSLPTRLNPDGDIGYFHASYHRSQPATQQDYVFLDTPGRGLFVGVTHTMRGTQGGSRGYLEGNERVYNDNILSPAWHGTGTEDFYESGWYFRDSFPAYADTPYSRPLTGNPAYNPGVKGFTNDTTGTYRLLLAESIPFGQRLRFTIQHGPVDDVPVDYSSVSFWYGQPTYSLEVTDSLNTTDAASRQSHQYTVSGDTVSSFSSGFPGEFNYIPVTLGLDTAANAISFRMTVDPANNGVRLSRISDQNQSYQTANVYIDGVCAGIWMEPWSNPDYRFLNDPFDVSANLTRGKNTINVRIVPLVGLTSTTNTPFWTASNYQVLSQVAAFTDSQAPGPIANLVATGGQTNSVTLSWEPDSAGTGIMGYQVYGSSTDTTVSVTTANLVGQTPEPGFQHTGLGLQQQWYYRVRALATNGQVGPISGVVTARTGNQLKIAGEGLVSTAVATAPVVVQGNCCGVIWYQNAQLWFQASKVGDKMTVTINVPTPGTYDLVGDMTKARDYGTVALAVDGAPLGQPFDGYNFPNVTTINYDWGSVQLNAGSHQLTFALVGKNASSSNYLVGFDYLLLSKTN